MISPGTTNYQPVRGREERSPLVDQLSGALLCPRCGEPLDIIIERTEGGPRTVGQCALCIATVEIAL